MKGTHVAVLHYWTDVYFTSVTGDSPKQVGSQAAKRATRGFFVSMIPAHTANTGSQKKIIAIDGGTKDRKNDLIKMNACSSDN